MRLTVEQKLLNLLLRNWHKLEWKSSTNLDREVYLQYEASIEDVLIILQDSELGETLSISWYPERKLSLTANDNLDVAELFDEVHNFISKEDMRINYGDALMRLESLLEPNVEKC